jgi:hypothetical protein
VRKPPSPHIPRLFAALAIITLLAVPVVVPVVVMKMTGKTGRKDRQLADAIEGPEVSTLIVTAPEETTQEEIQESFLKLNDNKVSPLERARMQHVAPLAVSSTTACIATPAARQRSLHLVLQDCLLSSEHTLLPAPYMRAWGAAAAARANTAAVVAAVGVTGGVDSVLTAFLWVMLPVCSLSVSADPITQLVSTHMSWLRQPWCPGVLRQSVSVSTWSSAARARCSATAAVQPAMSAGCVVLVVPGGGQAAAWCTSLQALFRRAVAAGWLEQDTAAAAAFSPSTACFARNSSAHRPAAVLVSAGDRSGAQIVDDTLRAAASRGINTVRMWAHTTNSIYPFQVGEAVHYAGAS